MGNQEMRGGGWLLLLSSLVFDSLKSGYTEKSGPTFRSFEFKTHTLHLNNTLDQQPNGRERSILEFSPESEPPPPPQPDSRDMLKDVGKRDI